MRFRSSLTGWSISFLMVALGCQQVPPHEAMSESPAASDQSDELDVDEVISCFAEEVPINTADPTPLHNAAEAGTVDEFRALLDANTQPVNSRDNQGATPLLWAATYGRTEIVRLLLSHGADVNARSATGISPLLMATEYGENEVVAILLSSGADVKAKNDTCVSALHAAASHDNEELVSLLIKSGANVDARRDNGETALYTSAARGQMKVA